MKNLGKMACETVEGENHSAWEWKSQIYCGNSFLFGDFASWPLSQMVSMPNYLPDELLLIEFACLVDYIQTKLNEKVVKGINFGLLFP